MGLAVLERTLCDSVEMETVACDLCGSQSWEERYRMADLLTDHTTYEFPVVRCRSCGLVWVNPRPTPTAMARFYSGDYHGGRNQPKHLARYARQLDLVGPIQDQVWLDVGCARGEFMRYVLERNPDVRAVGVDAYSKAVDDERIEFHHGDLREVGLEDARFDLISAWAVLEHVHEPLAYFKEVARLLKPGGRFLFVVTNSESLWSRRAYREDVPRHTYHFSHETLREYARLAGLEVARQDCVSGIFDGRGKGTFKWGLTYANGPDWQARRTRRFPLHRLLLKTVGNLVDQVVFALPWEVWLDRSGILFTEMRRP